MIASPRVALRNYSNSVSAKSTYIQYLFGTIRAPANITLYADVADMCIA